MKIAGPLSFKVIEDPATPPGPFRFCAQIAVDGQPVRQSFHATRREAGAHGLAALEELRALADDIMSGVIEDAR